MTHHHALHDSLLRPCVLHILRAAGYHSTKVSVLETLTDLMARYMSTLANMAANHAAMNQSDDEVCLEICVQDVRMAMQECGVFPVDHDVERMDVGNEDTSGVDAFVKWAMGPVNKEIQRVALEGSDELKDDYLTVLKKKHGTTGEEESRYVGTVIGKQAEPRTIKVEGSEVSSLKEWAEKLKAPSAATSTLASSRRQSSALSSLGDATIESMEF